MRLPAGTAGPVSLGEDAMSTTYRSVSWNSQKRRYDLVAGGCVLSFALVVLGAMATLGPEPTIETLLIRTIGATAFRGNDTMGATTSFESAVASGSNFQRFSPMDIAYLLRRLIYDEGR